MNPVGNWISVNQAGGIFRDIASDISINPNGMIYLAANYSDFVKFGFYALPGHNSNNDIFIATLDNNLNWTGVAQAGGWNTDLANSISLSKDGSALITGQFDKTTRFDTLTLKGYGKYHSDIFVARSSSFEPKLITSQKNVPVNKAIESKKSIKDYQIGVNIPGRKSPKWVSVKAVPVFDKNGIISYVSITFIDITEGKRAEEKLKAANQQLQATEQQLRTANQQLEAANQQLLVKDNAIQSSLNAIAIADLEGNLTYINPAIKKMWGYSNDKEILGRSVTEFWKLEVSLQVY